MHARRAARATIDAVTAHAGGQSESSSRPPQPMRMPRARTWTSVACARLLLVGRAAGDVVVECPGDAARCVRVGLTAPLSGWAAAQGLSAKRGAHLWADTVNADGGLQVGDRTMPVELTVYDDGSNRANTSALYQRVRVVTFSFLCPLLEKYG
eukprot:SAG31_NODE_19601_length_597_cov_1.122490_1_plen_152_part_10